jgi:hypothetical protein
MYGKSVFGVKRLLFIPIQLKSDESILWSGGLIGFKGPLAAKRLAVQINGPAETQLKGR